MSATDLASYAGLTAMALITLNLLLGLLVTTNYQPHRDWPHRKLPVPLFRVHNWTAYLAICIAVLHPLLLLLVNRPRFVPLDLVLPLWSPGQRLYNILGASTFYVLAFVVITSYFRPRLRYRPWKRLHWFAYVAGALMFVHGTLIDPDLKNRPTDFLDGEKVFVELCALLVIGASFWRLRRGKERDRWRKTHA